MSNPYKRTTDKQYSLLTHEMARFRAENVSAKSSDAIIYWNSLTDRLNALGPPYRTVPQWKKVWIDFKRFHSKRNFKSVPKFTKTIKTELNIGCDIFGVEEQEQEQQQEQEQEQEEEDDVYRCDNNSQSMHSTNSNVYGDECSYSDNELLQQLTQDLPEKLIPEQIPPDIEEKIPQISINEASVPQLRSAPCLRPSNKYLLDQTLQQQMANQTKLLEHLSETSSAMASLMERQVSAIEKQTEAIRRQASATEHHTLVMNSFIDMIRDKMPKTNSKSSTTSSFNLSNGNS